MRYAEHEAGGRWLRAFRRGLSSAAFVSAFLLPKCPLCVAAWVATFGISAAGQHVLLNWFDRRYRVALIVLLILPFLLQIGLVLRARLQRPA